MFDYLYEWMRNIAFYLIMVTAVMHVIPNSDYKRYIRFFTGLVLAVMLLTPILKLMGLGDSWKNLYENDVYQEQVKKMEDAAKYFDGIDIDGEDEKIWQEENDIRPDADSENIWRKDEEPGKEENRVTIEEIEIGR